jgi:G3E family GTPase
MSLNNHQKAPLTVIGGFLGAGKTTYLNALIRDGIPSNSLIVINDFGDINIDAELVDYRDERMVKLSNGCICCTLGGTLAEQLAEAMRLHDRPEAVFIETSGVADPARIADIAKVSNRLVLNEVVCLVDASQAKRHETDPLTGEIWRAQLHAATHILINRLSAHDREEEKRLTTLLRQFNPTARIENTARPGACFGRARSPSEASTKSLYHIPVSRGGWRSVSMPMHAPVDAERLQALLHDYRDVLLRAKGFLYRQDRPLRQLLQLSGDRLNWRPATGTASRCQLVCIGRSGERFDALIADLQQLEEGG